MMRTLRLLFVAVAVSVQMVAMADDSGKCGENLTWTYNESTKTLAIKGNGETYSYTEYKKSPWKNYRSSIVNISIETGITSIGSYVFEGISNLVSITFPNSLTFVGSGAFAECSSISVAILPESLEKIELYTFRNCSNLSSIILPSTLKEIGTEAFKDSGLEEIISYVQAPFPLDASVFSNYDTCKLIVPQGTLEKYQSTAAWNQFAAIVEDKTSGIDTTLRAIENKPVNKYYDLQGRKVKNTKNGLYIVDGKKIVIK